MPLLQAFSKHESDCMQRRLAVTMATHYHPWYKGVLSLLV